MAPTPRPSSSRWATPPWTRSISYSLDGTIHYGGGPWSHGPARLAVKYEELHRPRTASGRRRRGLRLSGIYQLRPDRRRVLRRRASRRWPQALAGRREELLAGGGRRLCARRHRPGRASARIPPWSVTGAGRLRGRLVDRQAGTAPSRASKIGWRSSNCPPTATP